MPAADSTITTTQLVWYFTEQQARSVTVNQIQGGEEILVLGSWEHSASNQTIDSTVKIDVATIETQLTGSQAGDFIEVLPLPENHPEILNGNAYMVTATRSITS